MKCSLILRPCFWAQSLNVHATGVQSAAVNVICELARRNPKNYLSLAPLFFKLMTSSTNNWVLIKIIKLVNENSKWSCSTKVSSTKYLFTSCLKLLRARSCYVLICSLGRYVSVWCSYSIGASFGKETNWAPNQPHSQVKTAIMNKPTKTLQLDKAISV